MARDQDFVTYNLRLFVLAVLIFFSVFLTHFSSKNATPWDSRWSLYTAMSILREGNTDLAEYESVLAKQNYYAIQWVKGKPYSLFPVGASLLALPVVAILDLKMRLFDNRSYQSELLAGIYDNVEKFVASLAIAWASVFLFLIGLHCGLSGWRSLLLVFIFAFCTSSWSTASRALWQHTPSILCLTVNLYLVLKADKAGKWLPLAAVLLALSFVARPTNAVSIVCFSAYVLYRHRGRFLYYAIAGFTVAIVFEIYSHSVYGHFLPDYYRPTRLTEGKLALEAFYGNLFSPARGLMVFTPVFLYSFFGWSIWFRDPQKRPLTLTLGIIILLHWLSISSYQHWWAGHCYGPRLFSDMVPYFCFFLIPFIASWPGNRSLRKRVLAFTFVLATMVSFGIHWVGANLESALTWNVNPSNIDENPHRLWKWQDAQFLCWTSPPVETETGEDASQTGK